VRLLRSILAASGALSIVTSVGLGQAQAAQQSGRGIVVGKVTEATNGNPIPAVTVSLAGTPTGTMTGADGTYRIPNVTPGVYKVEAKRVGFAVTQSRDVEVKAGQTITVDLAMPTNVLQLQRVTISGSSDPTEGKNRPYSAAQLTAADMPVVAVGSPLAQLQGKIAGVTFRQDGGPNGATQIQLRNPVSYRTNTEPMIIIDGVIQLDESTGGTGPSRPDVSGNNNGQAVIPSPRGFIGNQLEIDAQDIETMEVVRGAAAAALYGQRAANGAIIITTKRGGSIPTGTTQLTLRGEGGFSQLGTRIPLAKRHAFKQDAEGNYLDSFGRITDRDGRISDPDGMLDNEWMVRTYDPIKQFFGIGQTYVGSASLGQNSLATNFSASINSQRETGVLRMDAGGVENYSVRVNLGHRFNDRLRLSLGSSFNRRYADLVPGGNSAFRAFTDISPDVDITAKDSLGFYFPFPDIVQDNEYNPLYRAQVEDEWEKRAGMQINGDLTFSATPWLTLNGQIGYQRSDRLQQLRFRAPGIIDDENDPSEGEFDLGNDMDEAANGQIQARFLTLFGGFNIRSAISALGSIADNQGFSVEANELSRPIRDLDLGDDDEFVIDHVFRNTRQLSYLATTALDYNSRYIVEGLIRKDGNSLLGPGEQWQTNYRASAAWSVAEEPWWPLPNDFQLFKLRYSIGSAGNNPLFDDRFERYTGSADTRLTKERLGNANLLPEEVIEQEFGLDMSFRNRFGLELTYAKQKTTNAIREDTIVAFTGFTTQVKNKGDIEGHTYEATFEANWLQRQNLQWSTTLVADRSRSKITRYPGICVNFSNFLGFEIECEGYTFGEMYGNKLMTSKDELSIVHQVDGLGGGLKLDQFVINDEGFLVAVGPGGSYTDQKWGTDVVIDGVSYEWGLPIVASLSRPDGMRISRQVFRLGQALPDFQFGMQNNVRWKNWNVFLQLNGQKGGMVYNRTAQRQFNDNMHSDIDQFGKPEHLKKPTAYYNQGQSNWNVSLGGANGSDEINLLTFMEDAGFIKVAEMQVGYNFTAGFPGLSRLGMKRGNIALIGRNLYTITGYSGYDPEVGGQRGTRVDETTYPRYRTFSIQLSSTF
jgi:TonB-linked SusC/RagA family outer membrane protein